MYLLNHTCNMVCKKRRRKAVVSGAAVALSNYIQSNESCKKLVKGRLHRTSPTLSTPVHRLSMLSLTSGSSGEANVTFSVE